MISNRTLAMIGIGIASVAIAVVSWFGGLVLSMNPTSNAVNNNNQWPELKSPPQVFAGHCVSFIIDSEGDLYGMGFMESNRAGAGLYYPGQDINFPQIIDTQQVDPLGGDWWLSAPVGPWKTMDTGNWRHSAGIDSAGKLYTWGADGDATFGAIPTGFGPRPVPGSGGQNWVAVGVSGIDYTVALNDLGEMYFVGRQGTGIGSTSTAVWIETANPVNDYWFWPFQKVSFPVGVTEWKDISVGGDHVLALTNDGRIFSAGWNLNGQLGRGGVSNPPYFDWDDEFKQVGIANDWVTIEAGKNCSFAIKSNGTLWAWGDNGESQLGFSVGHPGYGGGLGEDFPEQVGTDTDWESISCGGAHSIAIKTNGTLWIWGNNDDHRLGTGNADDTPRYIPTQIGIGISWDSVAAGSTHSMAVDSMGRIWSWGDNSAGQLGLGGNDAVGAFGDHWNLDRWPAMDEPTLMLRNAAGGGSSGYAIVNGKLYSWGENNYGQLGLGDFDDRDKPVQVGNLKNWVHVSAGWENAVAINAYGELYSWGDNAQGQLGRTVDVSNPANEPGRVGNASNWVSAAMGNDYHCVALNSDGELWSWGRNYYGQLGHGDLTDRTTPTKINHPSTFVSVQAGIENIIALDSNGKLWSCGWNEYGSLGLNLPNHTVQSSLAQIAFPGSVSYWKTFSVSSYHGLAIDNNDKLWVWGCNLKGQLGIGEIVHRNVPVQLDNRNWKAVAAGVIEHSLGITTAGELFTWGLNNHGQLGHGGNTNMLVPQRVGAATNWVSVGAGYNTSYAINKYGEYYGWGANDYGQLAQRDDIDRDVPTIIWFDLEPALITATVSGSTGAGGGVTFSGGNDPATLTFSANLMEPTQITFNAGTGYRIHNNAADLKIGMTNIGDKIWSSYSTMNSSPGQGWDEIAGITRYRAWYSGDAQIVILELNEINHSSYIVHPLDVTATTSYMPYTISYGNLQGTTAPSKTSYTIDELPIILVAPTDMHLYAGYSFNTWLRGGNPTLMTIPTGTTGAVNLTADWTANNRTFTLVYNDGVTVNGTASRTTGNTNNNTYQLPTPMRAGYTFDGWWTAASSGTRIIEADGRPVTTVNDTAYRTSGGLSVWIIPTATVNTVTTLHAQWIPNQRTFTLIYNDGATSNGSALRQSGQTNDSNPSNMLPTPTRAGYEFLGWFTSSTGGNQITGTNGLLLTVTNTSAYALNGEWIIPGSATTGTLHAQWRELSRTFTLNYDYPGAVEPFGSVTRQTGQGVSTHLLPTSVTRNGYVFSGWYTGQNSSGTKMTGDDGVLIPASASGSPPAYISGGNWLIPAETGVTLYAGWTITTTGVSFESNGGSYVAPYDDIVFGTTINAPTPPTKTGYGFAGWFKDNNTFAQPWTFGTGGDIVSGLTVLYADWTANSYSVAFDGNGHTSGSMSSQSHTYDQSQNLTNNAFGRSYIINFDYNLGSGSPASETSTYSFSGWQTVGGTPYANEANVSNLTSTNGATVTLYAQWNSSGAAIALPNASRPTFAFLGWYDALSGGNKIGNGGQSITPDASTPTILYARWDAVSYTVTFNSTGGSVVSQLTGVAHGEKISKPSPDPTWTFGSKFEGWYKEFSCINIWDFDTDTVTSSITLYAKWGTATYVITIDPQNGTAPYTVPPISHSVKLVQPPDPARTGYKFEGWHKGGSLYNFDSPVTEEFTLYAEWTIQSYKFTYNFTHSDAIDEQQIQFNTPVLNLHEEPLREDYKFVKWYTKDGTKSGDWGEEYVFGVMPAHGETIYAKWIPDPAKLIAKIGSAKAEYPLSEVKYYNPQRHEALYLTLEYAEGVLEYLNPTLDDYNNAIAAIQYAIDNLPPLSTKVLTDIMARSINYRKYTIASYQDWFDACAVAQGYIAAGQYTLSSLQEQEGWLENAFNALVLNSALIPPVDKSELYDLLEQLEKMTDESDYIFDKKSKEFDNFDKMIDYLKDQIDDTMLTEQGVADTVNKIKRNLVVNLAKFREERKKIIQDVGDEENYKSESWKDFVDADDEISTMLGDNSTATLADILAGLEKLRESRDSLKLKGQNDKTNSNTIGYVVAATVLLIGLLLILLLARRKKILKENS